MFSFNVAKALSNFTISLELIFNKLAICIHKERQIIKVEEKVLVAATDISLPVSSKRYESDILAALLLASSTIAITLTP